MHLAPPSPPRHSTPLWPQVVILDFFDTFSSSSRRWRHQFMLSVSVLLPDFRRAGCVAARTGVGVTCRGARRALFCVDSDVYLVKLLVYQARTGLIRTLGCRGQATRPRQALRVHAVETGKARTTDTPTHDPDTRQSRRLLYSYFQAGPGTDPPARLQRSSSEASSLAALHRTCSRTARHSAGVGESEGVQQHLRWPCCRF